MKTCPQCSKLRRALKSMQTAYGPLHDKISDLIEGQTLKTLPLAFSGEDRRWLVRQLSVNCNKADHKASEALKASRLPTIGKRHCEGCGELKKLRKVPYGSSGGNMLLCLPCFTSQVNRWVEENEEREARSIGEPIAIPTWSQLERVE